MTVNFALPPDFVMPFAAYFLVANVLTLALFALGRGQSADGEWGRAEMRTLFLSMMGGWFGAKIGQMVFRRYPGTRGFGAVLNLSILVLPMIIGVPLLLQAAPRWLSAEVAAYSAQYAARSAAGARVSPLGAAYVSGDVTGDAAGAVDEGVDASGVAAAQADSPATAISAEAGAAVSAVATAASAPARQTELPRRFGPTSAPSRSGSRTSGSSGHKMISVAGN